jgi:hypothetical protein
MATTRNLEVMSNSFYKESVCNSLIHRRKKSPSPLLIRTTITTTTTTTIAITTTTTTTISTYLWLYSPLLGLDRFLSFFIFFTQSVGLLGREISPSQGRYLHTQDSTNTE